VAVQSHQSDGGTHVIIVLPNCACHHSSLLSPLLLSLLQRICCMLQRKVDSAGTVWHCEDNHKQTDEQTNIQTHKRTSVQPKER
jgi:hypothetical protein